MDPVKVNVIDLPLLRPFIQGDDDRAEVGLFPRELFAFSVTSATAAVLLACEYGIRRGDKQMSYIAQIVAESTSRSTDTISTTFIEPHNAGEAARILFASSPRHGKRFALAMHRRVARGLDTDLIEHWARVVIAISRMG